VLACNNYEVKDLGVMVSCDKILDEARKWGADIIGLSGLITPSLDEMIFNAQEMKKLGFTQPLLIGGATTSAAHTAIKIAPHYDQPVVRVGDASLVTGICNQLLNPDKREAYVAELEVQHQKRRERFAAGQSDTTLLPLEEVRTKRPEFDWSQAQLKAPNQPGLTVGDHVDLEILKDYIDWSPFFHTWELKGVYPKILDSQKYGEQARSLFEDAQELLATIIAEKRFRARSVVGLFPANSVGDDVELYNEDGSLRGSLRTLRQQKENPAAIPTTPSPTSWLRRIPARSTPAVGSSAVSKAWIRFPKNSKTHTTTTIPS
jgi:5-methyltetrahydrofolate--homocysteine methyltransferase